MTREEIKNAIKTHFQHTIGIIPKESESLFEKGFLDSFGVVEFLGFLESQFGVSIPVEEITESNFSTLDAVTDLIEKQMERK
ncbi:MAG: acyl carrier protein [Rhodocyclaceae bacterium]|nr:acyl carrier protein [Rhodocyclaceae bacterium]